MSKKLFSHEGFEYYSYAKYGAIRYGRCRKGERLLIEVGFFYCFMNYIASLI